MILLQTRYDLAVRDLLDAPLEVQIWLENNRMPPQGNISYEAEELDGVDEVNQSHAPSIQEPVFNPSHLGSTIFPPIDYGLTSPVSAA